MRNIGSKKVRSNKIKAFVLTGIMHFAIAGGIVWGTGVTSSSSAISKVESKSAKTTTKSSSVKSKYYKAAKALKNRN